MIRKEVCLYNISSLFQPPGTEWATTVSFKSNSMKLCNIIQEIKMNSDKNTPRFVGAAFLLQAVASAVVGLILLEPLKVPDNIVETMTNFANNVLQVRAGIVGEMITVTALVILSVLLYVVLKKQNRNIAFVALGLRLTEVALLAVSRIATFAFLRTSQAFVTRRTPCLFADSGKSGL